MKNRTKKRILRMAVGGTLCALIPLSVEAAVKENGNTAYMKVAVGNEANSEDATGDNGVAASNLEQPINGELTLTKQMEDYLPGETAEEWKDVRIVTIGAGVDRIGDYAFYQCTNLQKIIFEKGASIKEIGIGAFAGCTSLASIESLEDTSVTYMDEMAFAGCTALASFNIPRSLQSIGDSAFFGCSGLKQVESEEDGSLSDIGEYAFYDSGIEQVKLPRTLEKVGECAFAECDKLQEIWFYSKNTGGSIDSTILENSNSEGVQIYAREGSDFGKLAEQYGNRYIKLLGMDDLLVEVKGESDIIYNGKEQKPEVVIYKKDDANKTPVEKKYFDVSYENNIDAGKAIIKIKGKDGVRGEKKVTFLIKQKNLAELAQPKISNKVCSSNKKIKQQNISYTYDTDSGEKLVLKEKEDYTVTYKNLNGPGVASVTIKGKGNYTGAVTKKYKVLPPKPKVVKSGKTCKFRENTQGVTVSAKKKISYYILSKVDGKKSWTKDTNGKKGYKFGSREMQKAFDKLKNKYKSKPYTVKIAAVYNGVCSEYSDGIYKKNGKGTIVK